MKQISYLITAIFLFLNIQAKAKLTAAIVVSDTVFCENSVVTFNANAPGATMYTWTFGDNTPAVVQAGTSLNHTFYSSGTFIVTLIATDASNNTAKAQKIIRIKSQPNASFQFDQYAPNNEFCLGSVISISQWSQMKGYDTLAWTFGDGDFSTFAYPRKKYSSPGTYEIKLEVHGFCGIAISKQMVTMVTDSRGKPSVSVYANPSTICPGMAVNISAYPGQTKIDSVWVFTGDGKKTRREGFDYTYNNKGVYQLKAIAYNACGNDTSISTITVSDSFDHQPNFSTYSADLCPGQSADFNAYALATDYVIIDYGDGSSDTLDSDISYSKHAFKTKGTYTAKAYFFYECGKPDTLAISITIGNGPIVYPFYLGVTSNVICQAENVVVNGPYYLDGDTLEINFGDGTIIKYTKYGAPIEHQYAANGTYTITGKLTNICGSSNSSQTSVTVSNNVQGSISIRANYSSTEGYLCINDSIPFSLDAGGRKISNVNWTISDGSSYSTETIKKPFGNIGSYRVMATANDVCNNTLEAAYTIDIIKRMMLPAINFWYNPLSDCPHEGFVFDNLTSNASKITWNFGDGTSFNQPLFMPHIFHTYQKAGKYDVTMTAYNGCGFVGVITPVTVFSGPDVEFTISKQQAKVNDTIVFSHTPTSGSQQFWVFNRDEKDTVSGNMVKRTYKTEGEYEITLFVMNEFGCWDTLTKTVNISATGKAGNISPQQVMIYPNPARNMVTVRVNNQSLAHQVDLLSVSGTLIRTVELKAGEREITLNTEELTRGMYFIRIQNTQGILFSRLMLN